MLVHNRHHFVAARQCFVWPNDLCLAPKQHRSSFASRISPDIIHTTSSPDINLFILRQESCHPTSSFLPQADARRSAAGHVLIHVVIPATKF
jgi:hypothetical protein